MKLIVGLGNPGAKYAGNRHNIGFMAVDRIAEDHGFAPWRKAFQGMAAEGRLGDERVVLLKPGTFMNLSGKSVGALARFFKIKPEEILVAHDELDIVPGQLKLKFGGSHAGHNGLRDIHAQLGSADYWRLRIGVGHPGVKSEVVNWVLQKPSQEHRIAIEDALARSLKAVPMLIAGEMEKATMLIHTHAPVRPKPPRKPEAGDAPLPAADQSDLKKVE